MVCLFTPGELKVHETWMKEMDHTCYVLLHRPTQFRLNVIPNGDPGRRTIQWIDDAISCWFTFLFAAN